MGFLSPKEQEKPDTGPTLRRPGEADIWQISHAMAYYVLPHFAFNSLQKMIDLWIQSPRTCPTFFYLTTCQLKKVDSITEEAAKFHVHNGKIDEQFDFYMMEHPKPPEVDVAKLAPEVLASGEAKVILAPYFTVVAVEKATKVAQVFVLSQAPTGGGCIVRQIQKDGQKPILASGPSADGGQFLGFIRGRLAPPAPTAPQA